MTYRFLVLIVLSSALWQTCLAAGTDCQKLPSRVDPATCCPIPELITDENKEKCKEFLLEPQPSFLPMANEKPPAASSKKIAPTPAGHRANDQDHKKYHGHYMHLCFMNCALNDTGILNNDKLNEAALSIHLKKVLTDVPDLIPVLEKSFKTCAAKGEKYHEARKNRKSATTPATVTKDRMYRPPRCPPIASHLLACVFMETFMNCPATVWSKAKECNDLRNHMVNCKPKYSMEDSSSSSGSTEEDM